MDVSKNKSDIFGKIAALRVSNEGYPNNILTNSIASISKKTNSLNFLIDLHKSLVGFDSMKESLVQILTYNLDEIELEIKKTIKKSLKSMVSCGINPSIPQSFIEDGIDLELNEIDLSEIFKINPLSEEGKLLYNDQESGLYSVDFNTFLYNTIQEKETSDWGNITTNNNILSFKFNENGVTPNSNNNTLNVKPSDFYGDVGNNKKLPDLNNDYIDSIKLFNSAKLINNIMDVVFGVISSKSNKTSQQLKREVKIQEILHRIINTEDDTTIDDDVFNFSNEDLESINYKTNLRENGKTIIKTNNDIDSSISFNRLSKLNSDLSKLNNQPLLSEKNKNIEKTASLVNDGLNDLTTDSISNVDIGDKINVKISIIEKIIRELMTTIVGTLLSPKLIVILSVNHTIVHGSSFENIEDFIIKNRGLITSVTKTVRDAVTNVLMEKVLKEITKLVGENIAKTEIERTKNIKAQISSLVGLGNNFFQQASGSMSNIINKLMSAFTTPKKPINRLPPQLLLLGAKLRPGLSSRDLASRIIARQTEAGAPVGDIFSQSSNIMESMTSIMIEEVIKSLQLDAKIEIVIPPEVQVTTTGLGNMGAPIISQGATTNIAVGEGVIR